MDKTPHQKSNLASVMKRLSQQVPSRSDLMLINQNLASLQRELVKANTNLKTAQEQYKNLSAQQARRILEKSLDPKYKQFSVEEQAAFDAKFPPLAPNAVINASHTCDAAKQAVEDLERQITQLKTLLKKT